MARHPHPSWLRRTMEGHMAIAKIIEITASSSSGIENAVRSGIAKASETVKRIETAWIKDTNVVLRDGKVSEWRVRLKITFLVD
jgi:flavin-binding protein dodecin